MRKLKGYHLEEVEHGECIGCAFFQNGFCKMQRMYKNVTIDQEYACIDTDKNLIWVKDKETEK